MATRIKTLEDLEAQYKSIRSEMWKCNRDRARRTQRLDEIMRGIVHRILYENFGITVPVSELDKDDWEWIRHEPLFTSEYTRQRLP